MEEHILVGLSSAPSNARIIRTAADMASAFGCKFTALFVRTPDYDAMTKENRERLRASTELAKELGASVETVFGDDVSYQLAEYARLSRVTKIVVGRSAATRKHLWSKPTLTDKLTAIAPELDIYIIPDASADNAYRPNIAKQKVSAKKVIRDIGAVLIILLLATLIGFVFSEFGFTEANIIPVYLLAVLVASVLTSSHSAYFLSAVGSVMIFSYLFGSPIYSFKVHAQGFPVTAVILLITALAVGTLTDRQARHSKQTAQAAYRTNLLLETNQLLQKAKTDDEIFLVVRKQISKLLDRDTSILPGSAADTGNRALFFPIKAQDRVYGTAVVEGCEPLEAFENSVLLSVLGESALALENIHNSREKEEAKLLAENEKLRANLLRSISHDLRTPLTAISGNASVLLSNGSILEQSTRMQMYGDIYDDATWLHKLVENLLAVTKIEDGRMQLKLQPQLVEELVSEALQHISRQKSDHILTIHHEDDLLLAMCDARLIVQVLINLVDNAIKYTSGGSHITISTKEADGKAVFTVMDDGPGIPDIEKEHIFQMFYTGESRVADSRRSLGLGLSLCKSIVTAHKGEISVADNIPSGTVFTFTVPTGEVEVHE